MSLQQNCENKMAAIFVLFYVQNTGQVCLIFKGYTLTIRKPVPGWSTLDVISHPNTGPFMKRVVKHFPLHKMV
jgi:hypothetical protein